MYPNLKMKLGTYNKQAVSFCDGRLLVYADTHVDVFDAAAGDWVQTVNIRRTRPLDVKTGLLNLSMLQEMPHVTYLSNILKGGLVCLRLAWLARKSASGS